MARVKRGVTAHAKHKKTLKQAKGFYGRRKNTIRAAKAAVDRSMQYATRDRKAKKRVFRALWIQRLNAAVRELGLTYSPLHRRSRQSRRRDRSQGPVRTRNPRARGIQGDRRQGEDSPARQGCLTTDRIGGKPHDRDRLCPAHGALQQLAERQPLFLLPTSLSDEARRQERWRFFRLDPRHAEPSALGRRDVDVALCRHAAPRRAAFRNQPVCARDWDELKRDRAGFDARIIAWADELDEAALQETSPGIPALQSRDHKPTLAAFHTLLQSSDTSSRPSALHADTGGRAAGRIPICRS